MAHGLTNLDRPILTRPALAGFEATRDSPLLFRYT